MTDYSKLNDKEINKRVHALETSRLIKKLEEADKHGLIESIKLGNDIAYSNYPPDYCNSWGIMGPIIEREKIAIQPISYFDGMVYEVTEYCGEVDRCGFDESKTYACFIDKKPMRAAAIVYLMMNEGNKDG